MFIFKTLLYVFLVFPDLVQITMSEKRCGCMKLPSEFTKPSSVFCKNNESIPKQKECGKFVLELKKCYDCISDWRTNGLAISMLRSALSVSLMVSGHSFISFLVLSTRFIPTEDIKGIFGKLN